MLGWLSWLLIFTIHLLADSMQRKFNDAILILIVKKANEMEKETERYFNYSELRHNKVAVRWHTSLLICPSWPLDVCKRRVTSVDAPGHVQLLANRAYLNSSSHTTCSANFTWSLFSGRKICTYWGTFGAKSLTAQDRSIVCSSAAVLSA